MKKPIKLSLIFFALTIVSAILHNLVSGWIGKEEPVFFILTFVFLLAMIISVFYGIIKGFTKKEDKNERR